MARVVVDVMPKPEILDPQGKAVHGALPRLGFSGITDVRQGKRFELTVEGEMTSERWSVVHDIADKLLSNPVIEDFVVYVELDDTNDTDGADGEDTAWAEGGTA
ncbi:MAG: phosphoribosylformylglycinamidine synthase subunit PurS [Nocardioides sp.]